MDTKDLYEILSQTLPEQNDFHKTDYKEELEELHFFGIKDKVALLDLIVKHRETLMEIDADELDEFHVKWYIEEYGEEFVNNRVKNKFWFSYSALLRIALELEFGNEYVEYSKKRDGI
ncbi:hypothetical protein [Flavobacterium sp. N1719]|uniref:hypothetical protein n=1 Tax=Flavobacterium sp. N1719 TaxID=2885633 RepID=UPI0022232B51|nr:hypothetical protein [Flavobacterium sp. N1719]